MTDPSKIGEQLGEVEFNTSKNVSNPEYRIRNGDAASTEEGSKIYSIKGYPDLSYVTAESNDPITNFNGYKIFRLDWKLNIWGKPTKLDVTQKVKYKDIPKDQIKQIDVYLNDSDALGEYNWKMVNQIVEPESIKQFISILDKGQPFDRRKSNIQVHLLKEYRVILKTSEPLGYRFAILQHDKVYFWRPWESYMLPREIKLFLNEK